MTREQSSLERKQIAVGVLKNLHAQWFRQGLCSTSQLANCVLNAAAQSQILWKPLTSVLYEAQ